MGRGGMDRAVALVTGGTGGVGRAIAGHLARNGFDVVVGDLAADAARRCARDVAVPGVRTRGVALDVASSAWRGRVSPINPWNSS